MTEARQPRTCELSEPASETLAELAKAIDRAGLTIFATIDHTAGAALVGMKMPPTEVPIYDSLRGGTSIVHATPPAALDLPLHVLARVPGGSAFVAFHPAAPMLRRSGVRDELAGKLDGGQRLIAEALRLDP